MGYGEIERKSPIRLLIDERHTDDCKVRQLARSPGPGAAILSGKSRILGYGGKEKALDACF